MESTLGLFPLSTVLVPGATLRLHIFEERYKQMIGECIAQRRPFGVVLDKDGRETGDDLDPVDIGTAAEIREVSVLAQGRLFIVTRGTRRFRVSGVIAKEPFWSATVEYLDEPVGQPEAAEELRVTAVDHFKEYLSALLAVPQSDLDRIDLPGDAAASSYLIADAMQVAPAAKQRLLEADSASDRLRDELFLLVSETRRLRAARLRRDKDPMSKLAAPFDVRFSGN
ncbi:MAG TPA: LON peptidase substrate-binding domain-containing protein [Candidatus Eremiobacteraceae bacterium]|nr:LON peptidase substrate-binding domain-containing protein [Candidatus Eremiobacteraceae bacterium]